MKYFISFSLLFVALSSNSRTITGVVLSESDSTTLVGATIQLSADSRIVKTGVTNRDGAFELETDIKSRLAIEISKDCFNPTEIMIEQGNKNIELGKIYLNKGRDLGEVIVKGNSLIHSNGRTIIYPSQADVRASTTAIGLFQKLPLAGLTVDPINRSLSVRGGSPVILINGVPSSLEDIYSLQPKDINKIEYSQVTPARYADKGYSGLISITLKERNDGGSVYLWGQSAVTTAFMDGNLNFKYHQGPSQLTLAYNPSWRNYHDVYDNKWESLISPDFKVNLEDRDNNPFNYNYHSLSLRYDYRPNAKTLFSVTLRGTPNFNKSRKIGNVADSESGDYSYNNKTTNTSFNPSLDLFLRYEFNDKNSLEIEEVGTISNSKYRYSSLYDFGAYDEEYALDANSRRNSLISEISFVHRFTDKASLSVGYQNTYSYSKNKYLTTDYTPILKENNNYIYVRYRQTIGKFYFSLSTGGKLFWIENDLNKRHFIRNLSSLNLTWNMSNSWDVDFTVSYKPGIPSLTQLTDYPQQKTPYLIVNGNPNLKVSDAISIDIWPSFQFKKFNLSLDVFYEGYFNSVIDEVSYLGNGMFLQQSGNIKRDEDLGFSIFAGINNLNGFGANGAFSYIHYISNGMNWHNHINSISGRISLWWNKGPFTITYYRKFPAKWVRGYYVGRDENGDQLSVSYKLKSHWTFEASWMYMFERKGTKYPQWSYSPVNPFFSERYIKNNANMVVISVSYNTDFGTIFRTGKRSLNNSDNSTSLFTL